MLADLGVESVKTETGVTLGTYRFEVTSRAVMTSANAAGLVDRAFDAAGSPIIVAARMAAAAKAQRDLVVDPLADLRVTFEPREDVIAHHERIMATSPGTFP